MWRDIAESQPITESEPAEHEPGDSWLATGFTLGALLAIGVLVASVQSTGTLPNSHDVAWDRYAPATQAEIDQAYLDRDCSGLQRWLISAAEADGGLRAAHGSGSMDLLAYIDDALDLADCN